MSDPFCTLGEGLILRRDGRILECIRKFGTTLQFEDIETRAISCVDEQQLIEDLATHRIEVVEAGVSDRQITFLDAVSAAETMATVLALPRKYQNRHDFLMLFVEGVKQKNITRGQIALIEERIREVSEEIVRNRLYKICEEEPSIDEQPTEKTRTYYVPADGSEGRFRPPSAMTLSRYLKKYEQSNGDASLLVSGHFDRARPVLVGEEERALAVKAIWRFYATLEKPSPSASYEQYKTYLDETNVERARALLPQINLVSINTFKRLIASLPAIELIAAREGKDAARKAARLMTGHMPALAPLHYVEIDHAQLDLFAIDDNCCLPLGRPWVTVLVDRRSGVVLGVYISFHAGGLRSIYACIRNSLWPHQHVKGLWPDIQNDWISFGRGVNYVSDRGGDFKSPRFRQVIRSVGAFPQYCERRTPWHKPVIERFMLQLSHLLECTPGKTFSNIDLRGDYDPAKHAVVRFSGLVYMIYKWIVDDHNIAPKGVGQAPRIEIWQEGMRNAPLALPKDPEQVDWALGDWHQGTLRHDGIRYQHLNYANSESLQEILKRYGAGTKLDFVSNPTNRGCIYVREPGKRTLFRVPSLRPDYAEGLTEFQDNYLRKIARMESSETPDVDELLTVQKMMYERIATDLDRNQTKLKGQIARLADINSARVLDGDQPSVRDLAAFETNSRDEAPRVIVPPSITEIPRYAWAV